MLHAILIDYIIEPFSYGFMTRALVTSMAAALVCALLSCWLILVGWSLMGDAVSHAVLPGVVLAYILGIPFAIGAFISGALSVALIGIVKQKTRIREDAAIGIVFTIFFATGLLLVSITPSHVDLTHIIFGNILGVLTKDMIQVIILSLAVATVLILLRKDLILNAFDPVHTFAVGLSPKRLNAFLLGALAVTTVVALQVVGVILVVALLIIPGATARLLTDRFGRMLVIAPLFSIACTFIGILVSYHKDVASGAMIVIVHGIGFCIAWLLSPRVGLYRIMKNRSLARKRMRETVSATS
ncbi:metal ABC transporter permease [Schaalia sp. lx-260]|uniref:metal ABC transporter permease n=1 Tax=Schaalia sp. lx-260 TaxID=2899082 RepID=UPI001E31BDA7|nr:metal ABC transporter permease [Schaalia sp. lx-260]MCD4549037.1 metal ABC transporter permease [Schaalia sp. lx-260]